MLQFCDSGNEISGQDFGVLYGSLRSRAAGEDTWVTICGDDAGAQCVITTEDAAHVPAEESAITLSVVEGLRLWREVSNIEVDIGADVFLGHDGEEFNLGPNVSITCAALHHPSTTLSVRAEDEGIKLEVDSISGWSATKAFRFFTPAADRKVRVFGPQTCFPWQDHYVGPRPRSESDNGREEALFKLLRMFYRQRSRRVDTVEATRWSPAERGTRDELLAAAKATGVLEEDQGYYQFNTQFNSLKGLLQDPDPAQLSTEARSFYDDWLQAGE